MKFIFKADIKFDADNIDHAFGLLAKHFINIVIDKADENEPWFLGEMHIEPIKKD